MRAQFIVCTVLLCGLQVAFAETCGFTRDSDLDGSYTSSTSTDQCSAVSANPTTTSNYHLVQVLGGRDRLVYLVELCHTNALHNRSPELVKELASNLFRVATTEPGIRSRTAGQKNALACLSYADPIAAMELLPKVSFQRPGLGEWAYEDPRYNAAETIFINFVNLKPLDIPSVIARARFLGQTGQYPYVAVAKIIRRISMSQRKESNALLSDAEAFYAQETGFYNRDEEFLHFLEILKDSPIDKRLVVKAVSTFVRRLKDNAIHLPGDYYSEIQIGSSGKIFSFTDRNEAFLFLAFPIIQRFNPILASEMRRQDPRLEEATGNMTYISGGFVQASLPAQEARRQHLEWLQASLVDRIQHVKECSACDQQAAVYLTRRLTELNSQAVEFFAAIADPDHSKLREPQSVYVEQNPLPQ